MSKPVLVFHQVDEEMRQELAKLKLVVDKEKGGKGTAKVEKLLQKDLPGRGQVMLITLCVFISLYRKRKELKVARRRKRKKI